MITMIKYSNGDHDNMIVMIIMRIVFNDNDNNKYMYHIAIEYGVIWYNMIVVSCCFMLFHVVSSI